MDIDFYWEVEPFYRRIVHTIDQAQHVISMMYLSFDYGKWAEEISRALIRKRAQGVKVRLMVDSMGIRIENRRNVFKTRRFLGSLVSQGIDVSIMKSLTSMHIKMCAVDDRHLLTGGSNIGDIYVPWQDTNVCIEGSLSNTFHHVYDYVREKGAHCNRPCDPHKEIDGLRVLLTVPNLYDDIYASILDLIRSTTRELYIRTWYFQLNGELMDGLLDLIDREIKVNILFSKHTRVPPFDIIHLPQVRRLRRAGANIIEFDTRFMHSKLYWNDSAQIIVGSQNLCSFGFNRSFEMCVAFNRPALIKELKDNFRIT